MLRSTPHTFTFTRASSHCGLHSPQEERKYEPDDRSLLTGCLYSMDNVQKADDCAIDLGYLEDDEDGSDDDDDDDLLQQEFTCHCCYQVLVDPTTLNCGHNFCRHCLALWCQSSRKNECPECRQIWRGFPRINVSFRDLVEKRFQAIVEKRRQAIMADPAIVQALKAFQPLKREVHCRGPPPVQWRLWVGTGGFFSGVFIAFTTIAVVFLVYHWGSGNSKVELLVKKPLGLWTVEEVAMWMDSLGSWASPYREAFRTEQVNGRLLNALSEQDLLKPPYSVENQLHRRAVLKEVQHVQELGFKRPQTLWEYKAVNERKSLFLLLAMNDSPRFAMLYIYIFDYYDSFLPFIHISCPSLTKSSGEDLPFRYLQDTPDWTQWAEFLVKFFLLPYQLLADFSWDWLDVHYWTVRIVLWNALLLTVREAHLLRSLWVRGDATMGLTMVFRHLLGTLLAWFFQMLLWPLIPQFLCNCIFYWTLYFFPLVNTFVLIQLICPYILRRP
ncbi:hypothetical protein NFI96_015832 [Prochilodus magdalenae]|nr:hypothetical protein NFI96_015832 [Prochilodus magdalenae]